MRNSFRNLLCALVLCAASQIVRAQAPEFTFSTSTKLSGRIAFSAISEDNEQIFVADLDARKVKGLTSGSSNNSSPSWSPDGKRIAFSSDRDGNKEIYIANWQGGEVTRVTNSKVNEDNPSWLPSGESLVYYADTGTKSGADSVLMRMDLDTHRETKLFSALGRNTTPKVSPDGSAIAYSTNRNWPGWDICIWDSKARNEDCPLKGAQTFCRPAWSPSGKELVYSFGLGSHIDLVLVNLTNGSRKNLTSLSGREYDATYSPDGKWILFSADTETAELYELYLLELGKTEPLKLLRSNYSLRYPSWNGVSTMILEAARLREIEAREVAERALFTPTFTATATIAPSFTPTVTPTLTEAPIPTSTFTITPTPTQTLTATPSATSTYTRTPRPTFTPSRTPTATFTATATYTRSPTATRSPTPRPAPTLTRTPKPTPTKIKFDVENSY